MIRKQLIFPLIKEICTELGIIFIEEPSRGMFGVMVFENGRKFFLKDVNLNINYTASTRITRNKALTSFFLEKFGYCIPEYTLVYPNLKCERDNLSDTFENGLKFAKRIGYPVILKLNDSSQGKGIHKVYSEKDLYTTANSFFEDKIYQIQKYYDNNDYRVVVLNGKVISAYQRIPLSVIGDGKNSIKQLIEQKQNHYTAIGRDTIIHLDNEICENLARQDYKLATKLRRGEKCVLRNVSNLSMGGECIDLTSNIHEDYANLCINIARDFNLNLCGIDILCNDLCKSMDKYVILEINSAPGLDNYAYTGERQNTYVKELYREIILFVKNKICDEG